MIDKYLLCPSLSNSLNKLSGEVHQGKEVKEKKDTHVLSVVNNNCCCRAGISVYMEYILSKCTPFCTYPYREIVKSVPSSTGTLPTNPATNSCLIPTGFYLPSIYP